MNLYSPDGTRQVTSVNGLSYVGLYAADGSYNGVLNDGTSTYKGMYHPSGALNITVVTDPSDTNFFSSNGSLKVINSGTYYTLLEGVSNYLLLDNFTGTSASVVGRVPNIGSAWALDQTGGITVSVGSSVMTQSAGTGSSYTKNDTPGVIKEVGCKFKVSSVANKVTLNGAVAAGNQIGVNIYPSNNSNFYQVTYTEVAGDTTLAIAATNFAAAITANAFSISNGITATANGAVISLTATECPRVVTFVVTGTTTLAAGNSPAPTMANFITGANYLNGMLHFRLGVDGLCDWTFYNGGQVAFTTYARNSALKGLQANTDYVYRAVVAAPYCFGGLYLNGTLVNAAWGQDANMSTYNGKSVFYENGLDPNILQYEQAWVYKNSTLSLATIQAFAV